MHILLDDKKFKLPDFPINVEEYKKVLSSKKETGIVQSRAAFTRGIRIWTLSWSKNNIMPKNDSENIDGNKGLDTLRQLRLDKAGGSFEFYHPFDEEIYYVAFIESSFKYKLEFPGYYSITINLQEI